MRKSSTHVCFAMGILGAALLFACGKKSAPQPAAGPDANFLAVTSGTWKIGSWQGKRQDGSWRTFILTEDRQSARITYNADHTFASSQVYQGTPVSASGTWQFANGETTIVTIASANQSAPDSVSYTAISSTALQQKEQDFGGAEALPPAITGSATDTTFWGERYIWTH